MAIAETWSVRREAREELVAVVPDEGPVEVEGDGAAVIGLAEERPRARTAPASVRCGWPYGHTVAIGSVAGA